LDLSQRNKIACCKAQTIARMGLITAFDAAMQKACSD
jgi:hypothetical protein